MKEHLWKSKSLLEKLQCTIGGKKFQVGFIEKGKKNSFTLPTSPLPQGGTAQFQERTPWPTFIPWMKVTMCEWVLNLHRCCPSGPPLFSPTQKTEVNSTAEGLGEVGTQQLVLRIHQKDAANCFTVSPTKCFLDSIRKPTHKPLGTLYLQSIWLVHRHLQWSVHFNSFPTNVVAFLLMLPRMVSASLCRWLQTCEKAYK